MPIVKRSRAVEDSIVRDLKAGFKFSHAARRNGISPETLRVWRDDDPSGFGAQCYQARFQKAPSMYSVIESAALKGDWRAAKEYVDMLHKDSMGDSGEAPEDDTADVLKSIFEARDAQDRSG